MLAEEGDGSDVTADHDEAGVGGLCQSDELVGDLAGVASYWFSARCWSCCWDHPPGAERMMCRSSPVTSRCSSGAAGRTAMISAPTRSVTTTRWAKWRGSRTGVAAEMPAVGWRDAVPFCCPCLLVGVI